MAIASHAPIFRPKGWWSSSEVENAQCDSATRLYHGSICSTRGLAGNASPCTAHSHRESSWTPERQHQTLYCGYTGRLYPGSKDFKAMKYRNLCPVKLLQNLCYSVSILRPADVDAPRVEEAYADNAPEIAYICLSLCCTKPGFLLEILLLTPFSARCI